MASLSSRPLVGLRVLDFTQFLAGPYATQMLGDLGAEVVKVEAPDGDLTRTLPPHFVGPDSAYFVANNRNKQSIVIDLKALSSPPLAEALIAKSDVVIENFRPGKLAALGVNREELMEKYPRLIWCSVSGFGQDGPGSQRPAYDMVVQALSGSMSLTGHHDAPPVRAGIPIGDLAAGLHAVIGVLAALQQREESGRGQFIDIAMLDCLVSMLNYQGAYYLHSGEVPTGQGRQHDSIPTYRAFTAADGVDFVVTANTERMWRALCETMGVPELVDDPRFSTNSDRLNHREDLDLLLEAEAKKRPAEEWVDLLEDAQVPVAPVRTVAQALEDPQVVQRGMVVRLRSEDGTTAQSLGSPIKMSSSNGQAHRFPPRLGEHTRDVLRRWLDYDDETIDELISVGSVRESAHPSDHLGQDKPIGREIGGMSL